MNERFGAVVPAYNEAGRIGPVLEGLKKHLAADHIVVVDDGSGDDTARVAGESGVHVIRQPENMGKGIALKTGFDYFDALPGVETAFTIDSDGQHDPDEIPAFIDKYLETGADIIIGSRMADTSIMPPVRIMTNRFTSAVISLRTRCRIDDSQSGYRLIRVSVFRQIELVTSRFDLESEILIKAALKGAKIVSVPIKTIYADEKSKIHPVRDTMRFFRLVLKSLFW